MTGQWASDIQANTGRIVLGASGPVVMQGTGTPEGVVTAGVGSVFLRTDGVAGTVLYVKQSGSGNTGWDHYGLVVGTSDPTASDGEVWYRSDTKQYRGRADGANFDLVMPYVAEVASGRWYPTQSGAAGTQALVSNQLYAIPFMLPKSSTMNGIAVDVTTAGTGSSVLRAGIYDSDGSNTPVNLVLDAGTVSAISTGVKTWTISQALKSYQMYFLAIAAQVVTGTVTCRGITGVHAWIADLSATPTLNAAMNAYHVTGITGAFPATFGTLAGTSAGPKCSFKLA